MKASVEEREEGNDFIITSKNNLEKSCKYSYWYSIFVKEGLKLNLEHMTKFKLKS